MGRDTLFVLLAFLSLDVFGQQNDDSLSSVGSKRDKTHIIDTSYHHHTSRAALFSAIVPGAGQIYNEIGYHKYIQKKNRAWWKVPLIYGGLGVVGYYLKANIDSCNKIKKEYRYQFDNPGSYWYPEYEGDGTSNLKQQFDSYANRRDLFAFLTIGVFGLNVIEAFIDAHFVTFDASDNLSFDWRPVMFDRNTAGLSMTLRF